MPTKINTAILKCIWIGILFFCNYVNGQPKIGIGVSSPQAQLDVTKSMRMGGITANSSFLSYDSATANFTWNRSNIFAPANQPLIKHGVGQEGLYYNSGAIEYKNAAGLLQFRTHWPSGDGYIGGKLGIGRLDPGSPLHFPEEYGEKIIFYGSAPANYGIGVQEGVLQIHADQFASSIEFGYGSNSNFTELMRINGNGRVGIGTNDPQAALHVVRGSRIETASFFPENAYAGVVSRFNLDNSENTYIGGGKLILNDIPGGKVGIGIEPTYPDALLEVNGRINIRKWTLVGAQEFGAYYLNKSDNNSIAGFVGMLGNNIGLYGINTPASFEMNATTGALRIASNEGNMGQVLQSKGAAAKSNWVSPTSPLYNSTMVSEGSVTTIYNSAAPVDLPGLVKNFTLAGNATILVNFSVLFEIPNEQERFVTAYVDLIFDNNLISRSASYGDYQWHTISSTAVISAGPGSHTIKLRGSCAGLDLLFTSNGSNKSLVIRILNK